MNNVLIIGGSGYVGKELTKLLINGGYTVSWLSRSTTSEPQVISYLWDYSKNKIDLEAITNADYIINLSGANINGQRWNAAYKIEIYESRINGTNFLYDVISKTKHHIKAYIATSATGIYGCETTQHIYNEEDAEAQDFLAQTCKNWEQSSQKLSTLGIRTVIMRNGIVLSKHSKALHNIMTPIKMGIGAAIGSGQQYFPWVHLDDVCNAYIYALKSENMIGAYNIVAPEYITNETMMDVIADKLGKKIWLPNVPGFVIKMMFGEIADALLGGSRVSSAKIEKDGYEFKWKKLTSLEI
jgi:uncharacterized protein